VVQPEPKGSRLERRASSLSTRRKDIGEVLPQRSVHDWDRAIVEISHQHHGMAQVVAEQDEVAHHLFALEHPLPRGQAQMTVEDVQDGAGLDFEIDAQAEARLATAVTQVVLLLMQHGKRMEHRHAKRALTGRPGRAKRR